MRPIGRRRLLSLGLGGALGSFGLAACASGPGGSPEGSFKQPRHHVPGKYAKRDVVILWSSFGGIQGEAMDHLAKKFNKSQSDIYLDLQFQGAYADVQEKLVASLQSGVAPDMTIANGGVQGKLEIEEVASPLNDYIDKDTLDRLDKKLMDEWTVKGQIYNIPFARSTPIFYYNRDIYKKVGLPDRGPKTWSEFSEWAKEINKIKNDQGDPMPALTGSNSSWYFESFIKQWKGQFSDGLDVTVNKGGAVEAAKYFRDLYVRKGLAKPDAGQDSFNNGFIASGLYSTASLAQIEDAAKDRIGAAFLPAEKRRAVVTGGSGWTIPIGITHERKQAAAEVIKFLAKADNAAYWTVKSGYVPIVKDAVDSEIFLEQVKKSANYKVAPDQMKYASPHDPVVPFVPGSGDTAENYVALIYASNEPVQSILDRLAKKLQRDAEAIRPEYERLMASS